MKSIFSIFFAAALLAALPFAGQAQSSKMVDKMLGKAVKSTAKSSISIPGMGDVLGESALSGAINKAMKGSLKGAKKALEWTTKDLSPLQLTKIATSGNPLSTLMEVKGGNMRKNFEGLISDNLAKTGALDMLDKVGGSIPGFDLASLGGKEGFVSKLTDNAIGEVDKSAAKLMEKINI